MPDHMDGCLITSGDKHSVADGMLRVGDVLLKIDGAIVSEKGDVVYRGDEWLNWRYLITSKPVGDSVQVTVLRKAEMTMAGPDELSMHEAVIPLELKPLPKLLPRVIGVDYFPSYAIIGGLVIVPAGHPVQAANLVESQGRVNALFTVLESISREGQLSDLGEQVCVLVSVLAHSSNVTYDRMVGHVVFKVNGIEVKNMKHLAKLVAEVQGELLEIDFKVAKVASTRQYVVFEVAPLKANMKDILAINKIHSWCSPDLLE